MSKVGIYPGTFDPPTKGHLDVIERALQLVDKLIIGVADDSSSNKTPIFDTAKRVRLIKDDIARLDKKRIEVKEFEGLLINFAKKEKAGLIIRGLRAVSDFEYEFQMSCMNSRLSPDVQTVFLPASEETQFVSSKLVKEIARLGGNVSSFVSSNVQRELMIYYNASVNYNN